MAKVAIVLEAWRAIEARASAQEAEYIAHFKRLDAAGRPASSGTNALRHVQSIRDEVRPLLAIVTDYPETAEALLEAPELASWRSFLIGRYARWDALRSDLMELARAHHRRDTLMVMELIKLAGHRRDRALLDQAADLLLPEGDEVSARVLMWGYLLFDDVEAAGQVAVRAIRLQSRVGPLLLFLQEDPSRIVPEGALEALVGLQGGWNEGQRTRMPAELRKIGRDDAATRLEVMLAAAGRDKKTAFAPEMALAASNPAAALDGAERKVLVVAGRGDIPLLFSFELAELLQAIPLDAATAPRVLALAEAIEVRRIREEILARVKSLTAAA